MHGEKSRFGLRALRKKYRIFTEINLWGLVSILLVLLIIFMMGFGLPPIYHGIPVDRALALHSTYMPGAIKEDAMRIVVTRDGSVYFRNSRVAPTDLPDVIRERVKNGAEKRIYLTVDTRAKYADAEKVLDQVRLAGIRDVTFLTDQPYTHR